MTSDAKRPFGLSVEGLWTWGYRIFMAVSWLGILYLGTLFVSRTDYTVATEKVDRRITEIKESSEAIVPRVVLLEKEIAHHTAMEYAATNVLSEIRSEISSIRATQSEAAKNNEKNFDRIFQKIDKLSTH